MAPVDKSIVESQLEGLGDFHKFFTSKELRYLPEILNPGERVHGVTSGMYDSTTWIIVITNARLIFLDKGMFYGLKQIDLPLSQITAVTHKAGFFFGEIEVATSSGKQKITNITKGDVVKIASIIAGILHPTAPQEPELGPATGAMAGGAGHAPLDLGSQLEKIGTLYEKGLLSDSEFQAFKDKLLML